MSAAKGLAGDAVHPAAKPRFATAAQAAGSTSVEGEPDEGCDVVASTFRPSASRTSNAGPVGSRQSTPPVLRTTILAYKVPAAAPQAPRYAASSVGLHA